MLRSSTCYDRARVTIKHIEHIQVYCAQIKFSYKQFQLLFHGNIILYWQERIKIYDSKNIILANANKILHKITKTRLM